MNWLPTLVCALLGIATSLTAIPLIRRWDARRTKTVEGAFHHTHRVPVCRLGGIALALAFVLVSICIFAWFPVHGERMRVRYVITFSSLAMFLVGLWDDFKPLGAKRKLLAQIAIALAVWYSGVEIDKFKNPFTDVIHDLGWVSCVVTVFWLVALTNMINLIDGVDGLAGGIGLMVMGLLTFVGGTGAFFYPILCAAGMCGALLGFLRYNFPPARIYLGDGGAYFVGFLIAILTLVNSQKGTVMAALVAPLFALALPIVDVTLAIIRRGLKGLPIFRPDRKHIHHRLQELGLSRTRTVLILYGISSVFLLMAFGVFWSQGRWVPILFGFGCLTLILSARTFNFSRDWFAVGRVLENSLELRKETHYALAHARWLEMESERADDLDSLWTDYTFTLKKMGFTAAELTSPSISRTWESEEKTGADRQRAHEFRIAGESVKIILSGDSNRVSERLFAHLSDLAAESWLKAVNRWRANSVTRVVPAGGDSAATSTASTTATSVATQEQLIR